MDVGLFHGLQLLSLTTTILVLAHLCRIANVHDSALESPSLDADVVRTDLSDEQLNYSANNVPRVFAVARHSMFSTLTPTSTKDHA